MKFLGLVAIFLFSNLFKCEESEDPNAGNAVGMAPTYEMNFKVNLRWYSEDCYYHYLNQSDILHIIVNVLSGGDLTTDLNIYDPTSKLIYTRIQTPFTWYDNSEITISGNYKICVRNTEHHEKKVYINIISLSRSEIHQKTQELKKLNETSTYMMDRVVAINENVHSMRRCQILQRMIHSADSYYIEANYEYVQYYSIVQAFVIVISALVQTYFIKKLFESPASLKPRA